MTLKLNLIPLAPFIPIPETLQAAAPGAKSLI